MFLPVIQLVSCLDGCLPAWLLWTLQHMLQLQLQVCCWGFFCVCGYVRIAWRDDSRRGELLLGAIKSGKSRFPWRAIWCLLYCLPWLPPPPTVACRNGNKTSNKSLFFRCATIALAAQLTQPKIARLTPKNKARKNNNS